jgi:hypothetical protein
MAHASALVGCVRRQSAGVGRIELYSEPSQAAFKALAE